MKQKQYYAISSPPVYQMYEYVISRKDKMMSFCGHDWTQVCDLFRVFFGGQSYPYCEIIR